MSGEVRGRITDSGSLWRQTPVWICSECDGQLCASCHEPPLPADIAVERAAQIAPTEARCSLAPIWPSRARPSREPFRGRVRQSVFAHRMALCSLAHRCGNMLSPKEDSSCGKLKRICRHCHRQDFAESNLIYVHDLRPESSPIKMGSDTLQDPTLPRANNTHCISCGHHEAVFFPPMNPDEGMKLIFMCTK